MQYKSHVEVSIKELACCCSIQTKSKLASDLWIAGILNFGDKKSMSLDLVGVLCFAY